MTRRTIESYEAALNFVHENLIELEGAGIIIDFENAMRTALKRVCPNLPVYGCLFHFVQATTRKVASMSALFELVRTNPEAKFLLRKFQSLALLPVNKIKAEFVSLLREALDTHKFTEFAPFIEYFKNQWLLRVKLVHFSVYNLETRTTGPAEAFNGKVNKSFRTHGGFFQFVEALQKEEAVKSDQFSRDVTGVLQPDRRKKFYKKRSELISKYSIQLEKKTITSGHFLSIMANVNNEILYDEKIIFTHQIDIGLSNDTILIEGDDVPCVEPPAILIEDYDGEISTEKEPQRTTRKRKRTEAVDEIVQSKSSKSKRTATETSAIKDAPIQTRSKSAAAGSTEASKETATNTTERSDVLTRTRSQNAAGGAANATKRSKSMRTKQKKSRRAHVSSDDSDTDSGVCDVMDRISRNGPAIVNFRKRFQELENQENVLIDPDCFKCIICYERKKNTMLLPCSHQHTCNPCWIMWKIQQINAVPMESLLDDDTDVDEAFKPKCPVCKQGVDEFKEAKN